MIRFHKNEKWKKFVPFANARLNYAISNFGRLVSFDKKIEEGTLLKGSMIKRFNVFNVKTIVRGKEKHSKLFIHRLVAEHFLPNRNKNKTYVLHLNHNLEDNRASNLRWASYEEMCEHKKSNPRIIESQKRLTKFNKSRPGHKLTISKVKQIKEQISNKNRKSTLKQIAEKFDISEMQLYRIKSGENWSHVRK